MPITRKTVLQAAGTHHLGGRTDPAEILKGKTSVAGLSMHHVLPQPYMLCVGHLVDLYRATFFRGVNDWPNGIDDDRSKTINTIMKGMLQYGGQLTIPRKFAHLGYNLFQGPHRNFRADDPDGSREPHKPISMPSTIWDTLGELGAFLVGKITFNGYIATFKQDFTIGDLDDMVKDYLLELARGGHSNSLRFKFSDWIVMRTTSKANELPQKSLGDADKARLRGLVRSVVKPAYVQCYTPDDVNATEGTTLLWYLRSSAEPEPAAFNSGPIRISIPN